MLLMRLKTSLGMVAVPPPCDFAAAPPRGISAAALAASFPRRVVDAGALVLAINDNDDDDDDDGIDWRVGVNNALVVEDAANSNRATTVELLNLMMQSNRRWVYWYGTV